MIFKLILILIKCLFRFIRLGAQNLKAYLAIYVNGRHNTNGALYRSSNQGKMGVVKMYIKGERAGYG